MLSPTSVAEHAFGHIDYEGRLRSISTFVLVRLTLDFLFNILGGTRLSELAGRETTSHSNTMTTINLHKVLRIIPRRLPQRPGFPIAIPSLGEPD